MGFDANINVRCTKTDRAKWQHAASTRHLTINAWVRQVLHDAADDVLDKHEQAIQAAMIAIHRAATPDSGELTEEDLTNKGSSLRQSAEEFVLMWEKESAIMDAQMK